MTKEEFFDVLDGMRDHIRTDIAAGFRHLDTIITSAANRLSNYMELPFATLYAHSMVEEAVESHLEEQSTWPEQTDCDRLDAAFAELEKGGIICRQNFTCCGTCGSTEIWDEIEETDNAANNVRGYVFYHGQDAVGAVEGAGCYLNYGSVVGTESAALSVADEVVATLERHGLRTSWNGKLNRRIYVVLDWKRRRTVHTRSQRFSSFPFVQAA
jgi:hypothetical protein